MSQSDEFYKNVLDNLFEGVYFVDAECKITYWNRGAEEISGYTRDEVVGRRCFEQILIHTDEQGNLLCKTGCPLAAVIKDGIPREVEVYLYHKEGYRVPVRIRAQPLCDEDGNVIGAVEVFNDNSVFVATRHRIHELQYAADRDALTNIGNRRFSEANLVAALHAYHQLAEPFAVLLIDVDEFKLINDTYGHIVGDQMLKLVADTLQYSIRTSDYVGRWGGEEFLVILYNVNAQQIMAIAEKLRHLVEQNSLITEKGEIGVTISIGGTLSRPDDTVRSILERADASLYQSKGEGKNRCTIM